MSLTMDNPELCIGQTVTWRKNDARHDAQRARQLIGEGPFTVYGRSCAEVSCPTSLNSTVLTERVTLKDRFDHVVMRPGQMAIASFEAGWFAVIPSP